MVQLLAGIISLRRVLEANPGRSHGSATAMPLSQLNVEVISAKTLSECPSFMNEALKSFHTYRFEQWYVRFQLLHQKDEPSEQFLIHDLKVEGAPSSTMWS